MADKLSPGLQRLAEALPHDEVVMVHIMFDRELSSAETAEHLLSIQSLLPDKECLEHLDHMKMVVCQIPLNAIEQIVGLPGVKWLDVDSEVPLDELLD